MEPWGIPAGADQPYHQAPCRWECSQHGLGRAWAIRLWVSLFHSARRRDKGEQWEEDMEGNKTFGFGEKQHLMQSSIHLLSSADVFQGKEDRDVLTSGICSISKNFSTCLFGLSDLVYVTNMEMIQVHNELLFNS